MIATKEQKAAAAEVAYTSNAYKHTYVGGRDGIWIFHYSKRPSEIMTMKQVEAKANGGQ